MGLRWLVRARWRLMGAWLWPTFVALAVVDGVISHLLPIAGSGATIVGGIVLALVINLVVVVLGARPVGMVLRRRRPDLPPAIARDAGGAVCLLLVTAGLLAAGIVHRPQIAHARAVMRDADVRAAAWIGDHAPARFRTDLTSLSTVVIQSGRLYRVCAAAHHGARDFCVVVDEARPLSTSVRRAGSEPNQVLARGTG